MTTKDKELYPDSGWIEVLNGTKKVEFNDISHWDTSGLKDISKDPVMIKYVKDIRESLGYEPIFDSKKEKFLYFSKKVARFITHLFLTLIFTILTLAFINFIIHYFN